MVDCETVIAENGAQLTHDVWLVLSVVPDEHHRQVWSGRKIMRREGRKSITGSRVHLANTTHSIHLKKHGGNKFHFIAIVKAVKRDFILNK